MEFNNCQYKRTFNQMNEIRNDYPPVPEINNYSPIGSMNNLNNNLDIYSVISSIIETNKRLIDLNDKIIEQNKILSQQIKGLNDKIEVLKIQNNLK